MYPSNHIECLNLVKQETTGYDWPLVRKQTNQQIPGFNEAKRGGEPLLLNNASDVPLFNKTNTKCCL
jgi:hypothetical protein